MAPNTKKAEKKAKGGKAGAVEDIEITHVPADSGAIFDSSTETLDAAKEQVKLDHITKPWTRDAWERAKPFILEQRQKLESNGWASADAARVSCTLTTGYELRGKIGN